MHKILSHKELKATLEKLKQDGKKIVFTNGCFDILHVGHTRYLHEARKLGDILVLALNSDSSVRSIKGDPRPFIPQDERAYVASLEAVDYVTLFDDDTPRVLIEYLKPDVLVKGGDWAEEDIVGREEVRTWGGTVAIIPEIQGKSTTNILEKIKRIYKIT